MSGGGVQIVEQKVVGRRVLYDLVCTDLIRLGLGDPTLRDGVLESGVRERTSEIQATQVFVHQSIPPMSASRIN